MEIVTKQFEPCVARPTPPTRPRRRSGPRVRRTAALAWTRAKRPCPWRSLSPPGLLGRAGVARAPWPRPGRTRSRGPRGVGRPPSSECSAASRPRSGFAGNSAELAAAAVAIATGSSGVRGKPQPGSQARPSTSKRPMRRVEPERPRLRRTGLSAASKAGEPGYPLGPRFARSRAGAGGGLCPLCPPPTATAHRERRTRRVARQGALGRLGRPVETRFATDAVVPTVDRPID